MLYAMLPDVKDTELLGCGGGSCSGFDNSAANKKVASAAAFVRQRLANI